MNLWDQFLWVIYPYLMVMICIVGHIYRYRTNQLEWTAKSSEFLEKKQLRVGSMCFHIGILAVFAGHVMGLLIPKAWLEDLGISDHIYHMGAVYGGGLAGLVTVFGIGLLLFRRVTNKRVRVTSSMSDVLVAVLLFIIILMGVYNTLGYNLLVGEYDYRTTIGPWLRGILTLTPNASLLAHAPLFYKLHVLLSFGLFGLWPFTRLVHVWSLPVSYVRRSFIVYRRRSSRV